MMMTEWK